MKRAFLILISLLFCLSLAAEDYVPSQILSKVNPGDLQTADSENLKLWHIEQIRVGFEDGTKIVGTWNVTSRFGGGNGGSAPNGWTLASNGLYYYVSQSITFNSNGTYTTTSQNLYAATYSGADSGNWAVEGNQFVVMSDDDTVNGHLSYRSPINKINDYEWNTTVIKPNGYIVGLFFSKPDAPPRVPTNAKINGSDLEWQDNSNNEDGFYIIVGHQSFDESAGWSDITWNSNLSVSANTTSYPLSGLSLEETGRNLMRVQAFREVGAEIVTSPIGGGNVVVQEP